MSKVQKTAHKAAKKLEDLHRLSDPSGQYQLEVSTIRPRQVVAGQLNQLTNGGDINTEKMSSFELWQRGRLGLEVLSFDEHERAKYHRKAGKLAQRWRLGQGRLTLAWARGFLHQGHGGQIAVTRPGRKIGRLSFVGMFRV